jgi:hypothetical protein
MGLAPAIDVQKMCHGRAARVRASFYAMRRSAARRTKDLRSPDRLQELVERLSPAKNERLSAGYRLNAHALSRHSRRSPRSACSRRGTISECRSVTTLEDATMFLRGLGTAHPARRYTKAECLEAFQGSSWFNKLDRRARTIAEVVLTGDNGINARHLALDSLEEVFAIDPDTLHARFLAHAPRLAADAAAKALLDAKLERGEIDAIVVSTCTGYLCPGLSGYVIERLGLRPDLAAFDLVGHGCAAALPNWQIADALLAAHRCENVLSVCIEVSSGDVPDNDPAFSSARSVRRLARGAAVLSQRFCPTNAQSNADH